MKEGKERKKRKRPAERERERVNECRLHGGVMNDTSLGSHSSICPSLPLLSLPLFFPPSFSTHLPPLFLHSVIPTSLSPFSFLPLSPSFHILSFISAVSLYHCVIPILLYFLHFLSFLSPSFFPFTALVALLPLSSSLTQLPSFL